MPNEGRLKIGANYLKIGANYLRIGPATPRSLYLMACDAAGTTHQYLLKLSGGVWSVVAHGVNLLPLTGGISGIDFPPVGGFARQLGSSLWASGGGQGNTAAWRSDDGGLTWALKVDYLSVTDYPHGVAVARDFAGNIWQAERTSDIFRFRKSTDNGDTWSTITSVSGDAAYHVATHPSNANIIAFAGLEEDTVNPFTTIWVTLDGGSNWSAAQPHQSAGPTSDSTALLFTDTGDLLYVTVDSSSPDEILRVYKASSPYSSFAETDLLTGNVGVDDGPFLALSPNPQFAGYNWRSGATPHGRVWRSAGGAWTELAEPFAAGERLYGLCYHGTTLYAIGLDTGGTNLKVAEAANAGSGSPTWTDITAAVNAAAGVTLAVLMASALFEVAP